MLRSILVATSLAAGTALAAPGATLTWTAPTTNTDGTPISATLVYNIYQGPQGSASKTQVATGLTGLTTTITSGIATGTTICWEVTSVEGGQESAHSAEACKTFPASVPNPPVLTVK